MLKRHSKAEERAQKTILELKIERERLEQLKEAFTQMVVDDSYGFHKLKKITEVEYLGPLEKEQLEVQKAKILNRYKKRDRRLPFMGRK